MAEGDEEVAVTQPTLASHGLTQASKLQQQPASNDVQQLQMTHDQLLAKNQVLLVNTAKFYFQWALLIWFHAYCFFILPMTTNFKRLKKVSCNDDSQTINEQDSEIDEVKCNYMQRNVYIICFYLLMCLYWLLSAK